MASRKKKERETKEPEEKPVAEIEEDAFSGNDFLAGYVKAAKDVRDKLEELYQSTSVLPRVSVFLSWLADKIDPPATDENSKAEGDEA